MLKTIQNIATVASTNAARPAIVSVNGALTYRELLRDIAILSNLFADRRLPRGAIIFFNIHNPDLRLTACLAAMHCGLVPLLVTTQEIVSGRIQPDFIVGTPQMLEPELAPDLIVDDSAFAGKLADATLRDFADRAPDETFLIGGTSGTTGRMKFVAETCARQIQREAGGGSFLQGERVINTIGGGSRYYLTNALRLFQSGATLVRSYPDPYGNLSMINVFSAQTLLTTPATAQGLMDSMRANHIRCPSIAHIKMTGSLFPARLVKDLEDMFDAKIEVIYGTSEAGGISSGLITSEDFVEGYVGEINPGVELTCIDMGGGRLGRLALLNRSSTYFVAGQVVNDDNPVTELPDVGYVSGKKLYLSGRGDEVYNFSGNKIAFSQIEFECRRLADISDVGILSAPELGDPQDLLLAIVAPETVDLGSVVDSISDALQLQLARRHLKAFRVDRLPRNGLGKIDRESLKSTILNMV